MNASCLFQVSNDLVAVLDFRVVISEKIFYPKRLDVDKIYNTMDARS